MSAVTVTDLVYEAPHKRVLDGVNLEIQTGETVCIMGQSGSGKTTLLKLLTGLLKPTSGQITIDGVDITRLTEQELDGVRLKLGLVFQYAALFDSLNVYDNIVFGVIRHKRSVPRAQLDTLVRDRLAQVDLAGVENRFPSELSGGMQKRVGLARALAMDPSIVFYDEPTSGLDPITATRIDELIRETGRRLKVTSVIVSHDLGSIFRISDRIAMLHQGRVIIFDTPETLLKSREPAVQEFIHPRRHGLAGELLSDDPLATSGQTAPDEQVEGTRTHGS